MENHHVEWENSLFQWPFSIAFCMFTRGHQNCPQNCGRNHPIASLDGRIHFIHSVYSIGFHPEVVGHPLVV